MAIIECPECGKKISDKANQCPSCAYPIAATTIEATAKKWKGVQLFGGLIMIVGIIMVISTAATGNVTTGSITTAVGLLLYIVGRFYAWWHHG